MTRPHAAVDDHTRPAYPEVLHDETGTTCAALLTRAGAGLAAQGVTTTEVITDNAPNYRRSVLFAAAAAALDEKAGTEHRRIRPHCPWRTGKVERFNRTLQIERVHRHALGRWLEHYDTQRRHHALDGQPPISPLPPAWWPSTPSADRRAGRGWRAGWP